jgi:AcrR family transcriptional regulator
MSDAAVRVGLRERQRLETHRLIQRSAFDLVLERGLGAVSVQNICDAAGVSARTFFNHFRSKDEAVIPDFPGFDVEAQEEFVQRTQPDLVAALENLLSGYLIGLHESGPKAGPEAMRQLLEANPELLPRVLAVFEAHERHIADLVARRTGRRSDDLFCAVASLTASATMRAAFSVWRCVPVEGAPADPSSQSDLDRPLESLIPEAFSILRGLSTPDPSRPGEPSA